MLVLTRKPYQQIIITTPSGELITITVKHIKPSQVRLGFEVPGKDYHIDRSELFIEHTLKRREEQTHE